MHTIRTYLAALLLTLGTALAIPLPAAIIHFGSDDTIDAAGAQTIATALEGVAARDVVDLRHANALSLSNAQSAIIQTNSGSGYQALNVVVMGDSLGDRAASGLTEILVGQLSGTANRGTGGFGTGIGVSAGAGGVSIINTAISGGATRTTSDFTYNTTGTYNTLSGSGDYVTYYNSSSQLVKADYLVVDYVMVDGGGTFKVQSSNTSTSSGFADETGYTTIDTDNSGAVAYGVARIPVTWSSNGWAIRAEWVSGGDVIITDVRFEVTSAGSNNYPGINTIAWNQSGSDAGTQAAIANDAMMAGAIGSAAPDIMSFMFDDSGADLEAFADALDGWIQDAIAADGITYPLVIAYACGPKNGFDATIEAQRDALRAKCIEHGWAFVDTFAAGGEDWDLLDDAGWGGDGTHLSSTFYEAVNFNVAEALGLGANAYGQLAIRNFTTSAGAYGFWGYQLALGKDRLTSPAAVLTTESSFGVNLVLKLARGVQGFDSTGVTKSWNIGQSSQQGIEKTWFSHLNVGASSAASVPVLTDSDQLLLDVAITDDGDDTGTLTIQVVDGMGTDVAGTRFVEFWIDGDGGAPGASIGTLSITTGTQIDEITANARYRALTDSSGELVVSIAPSAVPDDAYAVVVMGAQLTTDNGTIADN